MSNTPTACEAARQAVRAKLAGLAPGQTGINLADEVADAAYFAAYPILTDTWFAEFNGLRDRILTEAAALIREHRGDMDDDVPWFDTRDRDHAAALLLAARTNQES